MFVKVKTLDGDTVHLNSDRINVILEDGDECHIAFIKEGGEKCVTVSKAQAKKVLNAIHSDERLESLEHENKALKNMMSDLAKINEAYNNVVDDLHLRIDCEKRKYYIRGQEFSTGMSAKEFDERIKSV